MTIQAIIKRCYIFRGIKIDQLNSKNSALEMMIRLIQIKYNVNLKNQDLKRIKYVKKFYSQI